jgi:SAM-dependent methyltransferase
VRAERPVGQEVDLTQYLRDLGPAGSEAAYQRLTGYAFVRRYVEGKVVADIGWDEVGPGPRLLAESARSVTVLAGSTEAAGLASAAYPAANVEYGEADPSDLPYPEDHFDIVVALRMFEKMEQPESIIKEARRVMKAEGTLIVAARDRMAAGGGEQGVNVSEFQELLKRHFERIQLYRLEAVAGGLVSPASGESAGASIESASLALSYARPGAGFPPARCLIAVCGETDALERVQPPYLLLDRDGRVFDECEDRAEDMELLREEIRRMQETEVQAFQDTLKLHRTEIAHLRAQVRRARAQEKAMRDQLRAMEESTTWRLFEPYRQLRRRLDAARGGRSGNTEGDDS